MFHGVTASTSRLEYIGQPGALNESYSDIFGVIIANFENASVATWNWKIGDGLTASGRPFRDMQDPTRLGQPAEMKDYRQLPETESGDWGGVHTNSGIHNRVAYLMLTAEDVAKRPLLTVQEIAGVFYLALTLHLSRTSQFADSRRAVVQAARTLFRTLSPSEQKAKLEAIASAFSTVGIEDS
jgi:Zn-dependent metalloprotease